MLLTVVVPKPGSVPESMIARGSGIVFDRSKPMPEPGRVVAYYEGNVYDVDGLKTYLGRLAVAADRMMTRYPTVACGVFLLDEFDVVGSYDYHTHQMGVTDVVPLAKWLGHHPADFRVNPSIFKQKVPCLTCPFRKEGSERHGALRASEYMSYFIAPPGTTFPCHKSVDGADPRTDWSEWQEGQVLCSGGLLFAAKQGAVTNLTRLGTACGWYDPAAHTPEELALVFDSVEEMLAYHGEGK